MLASRGSDSRIERRLFAPLPPLVLVLLIAFALRLWQLGAQSLWYDEAVSVFIAQQPLPDLIAHTAGDVHPPLYYILLHVWLALAGSTEFAAAYFSLFFGVLLVALVCRLARDQFGTNAGVIAAFLVALSSFNLWYSQEVRMYTLVACLAVLSLMLMARLWEFRERGGGALAFQISNFRFLIVAVAYVVVIAVGLYTHYYFAFLWIFEYALITLALVVRWLRARRAAVRLVIRSDAPKDATPRSAHYTSLFDWHFIQILILSLFAPWLPTAIRQATDPPVPPWRSFVAPSAALLESFGALTFGQSLPMMTGWLLVLIAVVLYGLGALAWQRSGATLSALALFGATLAPLVMIVVVSLIVPLYHVRYIFIYAAFFYVVLALSMSWLARRSIILAVLLLGLYLGGSLYAEYFRRFDAAFAKDDYRRAVQYIAAHTRAGDAVLVNAGYIYPAFIYYYPHAIGWRGRLADYRGDESSSTLVVAQTGSLDASPHLGWGNAASDFYATDEGTTARALDLLLSKHARVWVLRANDTVNDPRGFIRAYLSTHALEFDEMTVRGESFVTAQGFIARTSAASIAPTASINATFGERITLLGWSGTPTATAGSALPLTLWWKSSAPMDVDYHVSLALYDATGKRWAASDGLPVGALLPTGDWSPNVVLPADASLTIPRGTPPGDYVLQASLYDPLTLKSLPVAAGADGTRARLGRVQVARATSTVLAQSTPALVVNQPVFDNRVALEQVQFSPARVRPGEAIHAELMWHALDAPLDDAIVFLQLLDDKGRLWAAQESPPVDGRYPISQWTAGEYIRDARDLLVPPDVPDGRYHLMAGLYRMRDHERLSVRNSWLPFTSEVLELGSVEVKGREHVLKAPTGIGTPARVRFGDGIALIGYDVQSPLAASRNLTLTLYWQSLAPMSTAYKAFVHVVGASEQIVAQRDSEPGGGALPTTGWLSGEYLTDRYVLEFPPNLAAGDYALYVGFYDSQTNVRLTIFDADNKNVGDRWLLRKVTLR